MQTGRWMPVPGGNPFGLKREKIEPPITEIDWFKVSRNIGIGVLIGGALGAVGGMTVGVLLNAKIIAFQSMLDHDSLAAAATAAAAGTPELKFLPDGVDPNTLGTAEDLAAAKTATTAAQKAAEAATASAFLASHATSMAQGAAEAAKGASHAAEAAAHAVSQITAAQTASEVGLLLGIVTGAISGVFASVGIGCRGRYKAITIIHRTSKLQKKPMVREVGPGEGDGDRGAPPTQVPPPPPAAPAKPEVDLALDFPHVYKQWLKTSGADTPDIRANIITFLLAGIRPPTRPRKQQILDMYRALELNPEKDKAFIDLMQEKITTEPSHDPLHDETAFNVLRSLRYFHQGRNLPKWVEFE